MNRTIEDPWRYVRTLLILGRVSNLPTVWSNCLAGWWVAAGSGSHWERLFLLMLGATFLYLAGMFLNDAMDAGFDRRHRPERPIPSGAIAIASVWQWSASWVVLGLFCFSLLGGRTVLWALALTACIVLYDSVHKAVRFAPVLMAGCRFLLILTAASSTAPGVNGYSIWAGLALGSYIVGLSFLARHESRPGPLRYWPCLFLAAPIVLALVVNRSADWMPGLLLCLVLLLWIMQSLWHVLFVKEPNIGRGVASLLAGIPLVDLLAVGWLDLGLTFVFVAFFLLALTFQRCIPAT